MYDVSETPVRGNKTQNLSFSQLVVNMSKTLFAAECCLYFRKEMIRSENRAMCLPSKVGQQEYMLKRL